MSYARGLLSRGEEVVYESRMHWLGIVAQTWIWIVAAVLALTVLIWQGAQDPWDFKDVLMIAAGLVLIVAVVRIAWVMLVWQNEEYLVTTRRVIKAHGVLNKHMADSSLEKVNDAVLSQSVFGRIFGYGTLDILTAAEEQGEERLADFPMMAGPVPFKKAMLDQKELLERPDLAQPRWQRAPAMPQMQVAEPMPPRAGSNRVHEVRGDGEPIESPPAAMAAVAAPAEPTAQNLADTLERLGTLRDKGLITPEEFELKKQQLLERM
ncbi:MAG: PH domain-containing protein [Chloroflexota bacterium]